MINAQQSIGTCHEALQTNPLVREYAIVFAYSIKPFIQNFSVGMDFYSDDVRCICSSYQTLIPFDQNHSCKIIETMIPQQGKKKSANHIVRLEFCSEFSAGWKLRLVFYFFFSIFLLASSSLKDFMEWYISAMKQRAQSHELIVFEMTRLF